MPTSHDCSWDSPGFLTFFDLWQKAEESYLWLWEAGRAVWRFLLAEALIWAPETCGAIKTNKRCDFKVLFISNVYSGSEVPTGARPSPDLVMLQSTVPFVGRKGIIVSNKILEGEILPAHFCSALIWEAVKACMGMGNQERLSSFSWLPAAQQREHKHISRVLLKYIKREISSSTIFGR